LESGVGEFDGRNDLGSVGLEGKSVIEDGTEVGELEDFGDGEGGRCRGKVPGKDSWSCETLSMVCRGVVKNDDFGLEGGDGQTVDLT
jgi:hypothetical protein